MTLNVSFVLYLFYFVPQLVHNIKAGQIKKLSLLMHSILLLAYIADLIYGFGRNMEWQYKTVSSVGLAFLLVQHFQILFTYQFTKAEKLNFQALTGFAYLAVFLAVFFIISGALEKETLVALGSISQVGWLTYAIPQIYKNYLQKSTNGLSLLFVCCVLLITFCDVISAWCLDWDMPNKIGSIFSLFIKIALLGQFLLYSEKQENSV